MIQAIRVEGWDGMVVGIGWVIGMGVGVGVEGIGEGGWGGKRISGKRKQIYRDVRLVKDMAHCAEPRRMMFGETERTS